MKLQRTVVQNMAMTRGFSTTAAKTPKKTPHKMTNQQIVDKTDKYVCHNYSSFPMGLYKGKGVAVWDVEGKRYLDFLCGYSSTNQGHCHPKIVAELRRQAGMLTQTSRAFNTDKLAEAAEYLCKLVGYDKMLPCNGGVEAVETACKLARRYAYLVKGIPDNQAKILFPKGCFWGRTITASGACDDPVRYTNFGPFTPGFELFNYNDVQDLKTKLETDKNICAVVVEPIQGEAGVIIPNKGYLKEVSKLCKKHNVLLVTDEVQTGWGRTGKLFCYEYEDVKPDIVTVGKALSGGMMPVSAAFANNNIMDLIKPGDHGSTFGGNPLGMAVSKVAIETLIEEKMVENSAKMGEILLDTLNSSIKSTMITDIRGKGLFVGLQVNENSKVDGVDFAKILFKRGLLTKATHEYVLRLAPALVVNEKQIQKACKLVKYGVNDLVMLNRERKKEGHQKVAAPETATPKKRSSSKKQMTQ